MIHHNFQNMGFIKPSTLALYEFDNSNVLDSTKNHYDLTVNGSVGSPSSPKQGAKYAGDFNSGYFTFPSSFITAVTGLNTYTLEMFIYKIGSLSNDYVWTLDGSVGPLLQFETGTNRIIFRNTYTAEYPGLVYDPGFDFSGTWNHIALVVNGTTSRKMYWNNVLVASDGGDCTMGTGISVIKIGQFPSVGTAFNGNIDMFRYSNKAMPGPFPTTD